MRIVKTAVAIAVACLPVISAPANAADGPNGPGAAHATEAPERPVAAYPKGHFAALDSRPDWGGVWVLNFSMPKPGTQPSMPALKGSYLVSYQAWQRQVQATQGDVPHEGSYCRPPGMPVIMMSPQYPIEFLFTPGRVTIHHEAWMQWRNIYTDGRQHPSDLDPTFNGHSIGRWEGNTLVVDTVGLKGLTEIGMGMKHSEQLRIVERIHLAGGDPDTLVDEMTLFDPEALEKPWTTQLTWKRDRKGELLEFECAENDRNPVDAAGHTGFR